MRELINTLGEAPVSVDEIGRGMHKCFVNARELLADAETLLERSPGRAISLAVLASEELAKVAILAEAAARMPGAAWSAIQRELRLRSHREKQNVFAMYGRRVLDKVATLRGAASYYQTEVPGDISELLDAFKQWGFYVDAADGKFFSPKEFGTDNREWADWLISVIRERVESFRPLHETEEQSIRVAQIGVKFAGALSTAKSEEELKSVLKELVRECRGGA